MGYVSLQACLDDLAKTGQLIVLEQEVDPHLEAAEIQRRMYAAGGPAILFRRLKGSSFPAVSNLFGTLARARYLFRDALPVIEFLGQLAQGNQAFTWSKAIRSAWLLPRLRHVLPRGVWKAPVTQHQCRLSSLPAITSWPQDGGPFVTLPIVHSESPTSPGWRNSNLGMYRVQLAGNQYQPDKQVGLHYQIHRGIGVHHQAALATGRPLPVNVYIGGPPAMTLAAVMPLPEGMPELAFAGLLGGRATRWAAPRSTGWELPLWADADFCLAGRVYPGKLLPEGPFGDHLGYYSLQHDYPVLEVERVYHRPGAVWPFTAVGRPPQEDTVFGELIHSITGPLIPKVLAGVKAVHAVDAAGVHPLLLALGSERYQPFQTDHTGPQELLTQASAILGQGQLSLAKYLWIMNAEARPGLDIHHIPEFFTEFLRRVDWKRDLHFITRTTIDTLDYSGTGVNQGSKLVLAAHGPPLRELPTQLPVDTSSSLQLPDGFSNPRPVLPGVLVIQAPAWGPLRNQATQGASDAGSSSAAGDLHPDLERFCQAFDVQAWINRWPLVVLVDDADFTAKTLNNWLWVTFTRSNPADDIHGIGAQVQRKHWGCWGSLVIDARLKPHHAPPLVEDPAISRGVDALAARGGPLHGFL